MRVRTTARRDKAKWRELSPKCRMFIRESLFEPEHFFNPPSEPPNYDEYMTHRFHKNEAFAAIDERDNWLGAVALCKNEQRISLLAIDEQRPDFWAIADALILRALRSLGGARPAQIYLIATGNPLIDDYLALLARHGFRRVGHAYENGIEHHVCERPIDAAK